MFVNYLYPLLLAYFMENIAVRQAECRAPGHPLVVQYQDMRNPHPFVSASSQQQMITTTKRLRIIAVEVS